MENVLTRDMVNFRVASMVEEDVNGMKWNMGYRIMVKKATYSH